MGNITIDTVNAYAEDVNEQETTNGDEEFRQRGRRGFVIPGRKLQGTAI